MFVCSNLSIVSFFHLQTNVVQKVVAADELRVDAAAAAGDNDGHCVWYGVCHKDPATTHKLYCSYNGTAKQLDDDGRKLLSVWCPHVLEKYDGLTCCDNEQVRCGVVGLVLIQILFIFDLQRVNGATRAHV